MKTKIKHFLLLFLVVCSTSIFAQNNSVGIGTTTPDNSAILDLVSNNQGLLIPRNNTSGITSIGAPSDGLIIYNTDDKCYWFWNNSAWKRLCETDSLLTLINNLGDTIGFIYDSLAVHNTNIFNNTTNINNLYDSLTVYNNSITNLTTIVNNHSDSLGWIYDSLSVYNNLVNTNITNITNNTTNIQNLSDSLGWVYDSLAVHNTNITINTTNINNLYDSVNVINNHLGVVDSTLLNKWDIYGNTGTNPITNFLGTIDNQDLVFRTINTEKVRVTTTGRLGIGTNAPTELLDINSNALRLRTGATNNFVLTTDATGVGTWQDPSLNPILTTYITTTTAPLGNDWKLLGNAGTNASTNFLGTTDNVDLVFKRFGVLSGLLNISLSNTSFGVSALNSNTTGINNTANGVEALFFNTTGEYNTANGVKALYFNTIGGYNTAIGVKALYSNTSGTNNTATGINSLNFNTIGVNNTANGSNTLYSNISGNYNTANGSQALYSNTTGNYNTANGSQALYTNTTGINNTAIGVNSLYANTLGTSNTGTGYLSLNANTTGVNNTANGVNALGSNTIGVNNSATGVNALIFNTTGDYNTAHGINTLYSNTTGGNNTGIGETALYSNTTGIRNVACGGQALYANTTGINNTAIGYRAAFTGNYSNSTALGSNSNINASNKIRLGDATVTVIEGQVAYTFPSDGRFKNNVTEEIKGLDFILRLRPVLYNFDTKKFEDFLFKNLTDSLKNEFSEKDYSESTAIRQSGFIAQEVEQAAKESGYNFNGVHKPSNENDNYSVAYSLFVVPLVKAIQEQQEQIEQLFKENIELKKLLLDSK